MIVGAREMETGWSRSGPEAGYFPLRIGILIVLAASAVLVREAFKSGGQGFVSRPAALNMALFAVPLIGLIAATPWIGIYLAAASYLGVAIGLVGRVHWARTLTIAVLTPTAMFALFEFAFRTPLPKGPLGPLLGLL